MLLINTGIVTMLSTIPFTFAEEEEDKRQIEEVIVTAERVESTVSDTSISITAVTSEMLEDLGIQSADEFVNFIPATTRDTYDIRIRGSKLSEHSVVTQAWQLITTTFTPRTR